MQRDEVADTFMPEEVSKHPHCAKKVLIHGKFCKYILGDESQNNTTMFQ